MNTPRFFLLLLMLFCACQPDANKQAAQAQATTSQNVRLECEDIGSTEELPRFAVYAVIEERKTKIVEITSACQMIASEEYTTYQIPQDALTAVGGWWAGAGDYFYAKSAEDAVEIFHATMDEAQENADYSYKKIATYKNGRMNVEMAH